MGSRIGRARSNSTGSTTEEAIQGIPAGGGHLSRNPGLFSLPLGTGRISSLPLRELFHQGSIRGGFLDAADVLVHEVVIDRGTIPAVVLIHAAFLQLDPAVPVAERLPGPHQGCVEVDRFKAIEAEACAAVGSGDVGRNGVNETTNLANNGH